MISRIPNADLQAKEHSAKTRAMRRKKNRKVLMMVTIVMMDILCGRLEKQYLGADQKI